MRLVIGGVRGTSSVAQPGFMKYGGETTSFLIEGGSGERILVDAGTGVRRLGDRLDGAEGGLVVLLFTHYHLDHLIGLPSLSLIYNGRWSVRMAAPVREGFAADEVVPRLLHKPFWPLQLESLESNITYTTLPRVASAEPMTWRGIDCTWAPLHHPGGCTAYRFDEPATGASLVIATDMEWKLSTPEERGFLLNLCARPAPAKLLVMDGQFADAEYESFRGWGHSTWEDVIEVARQAGVGRALITHHAPAADDARLDARAAEIAARWAGAGLAREGEEIALS
jgi:ribonuclease BN (tRNA processing enzyme)